jgi:hypothetical protein
MAEGGANDVLDRLVPIGSGSDDESVLATGLSEQAEVRAPGEEELGGGGSTGEDDGGNARVCDEAAADVIVRCRHKLQDFVRESCLPEYFAGETSTEDGLGGRLEDDGIASAEGGGNAAEGDGEGEIPGGRYGDDTERVRHCTRPGRLIIESPGVVGGEIHRFGELGIGLSRRLTTIENHGSDELAEAALKNRGSAKEGGAASGIIEASHRGGGGLERESDISIVRHGVTVGTNTRPGRIMALARQTLIEVTSRNTQGDVGRAGLQNVEVVTDPLSIGGQGPIGISSIAERTFQR